MSKRPPVSDTELDVLKALWQTGASTVRELTEEFSAQGRAWAYTTVQTLLNRLEAKGYVTRDNTSHAHVYRPVFTRDRLLSQRLGDLANQLCSGEATPLVMALVGTHKFSKEEIVEFRRMLDAMEHKN